MAMCKDCNDVFMTVDMIDGRCKDCDAKFKKENEDRWHIEHPASKPGLVVCKCCEKEISKNSKQCVHCGEENLLEIGAETTTTQKDQDRQTYTDLMEKSRATSFWLTLFFGPIGVLYSNVVAGVIMIMIALAFSYTIVVPLIVWLLSMLLGDSFTTGYNEQLTAKLKLTT